MTETSEPRVGAGNVRITLGGRELELKPSVAAIKVLSRQAGGIRGAITTVMNLDIEMINTTVRTGLGSAVVKELGGADKVEELVYAEGLTDNTGGIVEKCVEYLMNLTRGGRPASAIDEDGSPRP